VGSALLVFVSIAGFAELYTSADHRVAVLVVTRTIVQGQPIRGVDLAEADTDLSGPVTPIPVAEAPTLAGERAAVTIPGGSLLVRSDLTGAPAVTPGDAVVGLALKAGELPASGVEPGDQVMVVQTAQSGAPIASTGVADGSSGDSASTTDGTGSTGVLVPQASVFDVQLPPADAASGTMQLVSVEVASTVAAAVTTAANAGQVSLVLLPASSSGADSSSGEGR
jgi:hypothetical protein